MLLVMLVYWLLAAKITVVSGFFVSGLHGRFSVRAGLLGLWVRQEGTIDFKRHMFRLRGGREIRWNTRPKRWPQLTKLVRAGQFEAVRLLLRLGLNDAAETAVASGAVQAAFYMAFAQLHIPADIRVEPVYSSPLFLLEGQGIYSFRAGDIIHAALAAVWKRKRSEGFTWKSIPLRA